MKFSNYFIPTSKEEPTGVDYISQKLMLKSGMMKQVSSGLFVYLPTFMRVAEKVCKVIHEKMESVNAVPVKFPILVAKEDLVAVDYTKVKNVKKPAGGKPGLVIYHTNWSCVVTPNAERIKAMRIK